MPNEWNIFSNQLNADYESLLIRQREEHERHIRAHQEMMDYQLSLMTYDELNNLIVTIPADHMFAATYTMPGHTSEKKTKRKTKSHLPKWW